MSDALTTPPEGHVPVAPCPPPVALADWCRRAQEPGQNLSDWAAKASAAYDRVVVVGAHPDDETIGAGRLLATLSRYLPTVAIVLTAGEACYGRDRATFADIAAVRQREWRAACHDLCVEPLETHRWPDGDLSWFEQEATALLAGVVEGSDLVVAPWRYDPHPDHVAAAHAARRVCEGSGAGLVEFPVWAPYWLTPEEVARAGTSFTAHPAEAQITRRWRRALGRYTSQLEPRSTTDAPVVPADLFAHHPHQWVVDSQGRV